MQLQIHTETKQVVAFGSFPAGVDDESIGLVTVDDTLADALTQPGIKTLAADGSINVTPGEEAIAAEQAAATVLGEREEARRTAAQNLITTAATPEQAAALTAFIQSMGLAVS